MRVFKNGQLQIYFIELNTNIGICLKLKSHSIENKIYGFYMKTLIDENI